MLINGLHGVLNMGLDVDWQRGKAFHKGMQSLCSEGGESMFNLAGIGHCGFGV